MCGGHTLTVDTATTETMVLSTSQAISLLSPIGVEEGIQCDHGALNGPSYTILVPWQGSEQIQCQAMLPHQCQSRGAE